MKLPLIAIYSLLLAGCAAGLKEIKPDSDFSSDENRTFVYGLVETSSNTKFNMQFKNLDDQKMYAFSTSRFSMLPFGKEKIPFSFQMKPGKWKFVAIGAGPSFANISVSGDKGAVDSLMTEQYSGFDTTRTVAILMQ